MANVDDDLDLSGSREAPLVIPPLRVLHAEPAGGDIDWMAWLDLPGSDTALTEPPVDITDPNTASATAQVALDPDPIAPLVDSVVRRRTQRARKRRGTVVVAAAASSVLVAGLVVFGVVLSDTDTTAAPPPPPPPPLVAAAPAPVSLAPWCPSENSANRVVGNGSGSIVRNTPQAMPGAAEILDLEHAMYVARSAEATRTVMAPTAKVAPIEATRAAIATIPANTQHCVHIVPVAPDRLGVTVEERRPDQTVSTHDLLITTAREPDGRILIASIEPGAGAR